MVVLERPIKTLGLFDVRIALHPEVAVTVQVNVARSPEEAELQKEGVDVMAEMFEKNETGFTEDYDPNTEPGRLEEHTSELQSRMRISYAVFCLKKKTPQLTK